MVDAETEIEIDRVGERRREKKEKATDEAKEMNTSGR